MTGLLTALSGANIIYGSGLLESGISYSHAQLVMDNDFFKMVKYVLKGIPVNDETLAVDVIKEICPGGDFMMADHTMKYMRDLGSRPQIIDRNNRANWEATDGMDMATRARERANKIIAEHQPDCPLSEDILAKMHQIVADADAELAEMNKK